MDARTKGIALQNATNAAATVYAAIYSGQEFDSDAFDRIKANIFDGNVLEIEHFEAAEPVPTLGPVQQVQAAFPGAQVVEQAAPLASVTPIPTPAAQLAVALAPAVAGPTPAGPGPAAVPAASNVAASAGDQLWQQLFDDYAAGRHNLWYDNREKNGQPNPKASINGGNGPDFKLKADTDKALWVVTKYGSTPQWVKEKLGVA